MAEASSTDDVLTLRIRFKSETLERFIERYGGDLGPDEVFVRTRQPLAIGTPLAFEFTLADGGALLSGRGTVTWVRGEADVAGPPGMGVRFTSLPAASWQVLRRILAASGRGEPALPGGPAAARRITPLGAPPLAVPDRNLELARTTPQARYVPEGQQDTKEDNERTEVARVPPNFFELANEAPRTERARTQPPTRRAPEPETVENLALGEMDDITTTVPRPGLHRLNPPATRDPSGPWRLPTGPGGDSGPISLGRSSATPAYQGTTPTMGVRESAPPNPLGEVSSTAPTLPATAAVLLYDPDDPRQQLQPADQARPAAAPSTPLPASHSSPLVVPPITTPPSYQPNFYAPPPPPAESATYPETNFDPTRYAGPGRATGTRPTVGRIGPAISPEEMALASSAVRGVEGEAPMWPGIAPEEPPRASTAKIWIALTLAAAGVIALVLLFFPMLSKQPGSEPAAVTPPAPESPGTPPAMVPPTTAPPAPGAATPPVAATAPAATGEAPPPPAAAPKEAPPPAKPPGRAARDEATPPTPRPRRRRRNPADVIAEAEARAARVTEPATPDPVPAPSEPAISPPAVPAAGEGPPVAETSEDAYWLSVRSTPSGADVYVDGQFEGKTPFQRRIFDPARTYTLSVRKPGFTTVDRTVTAGSDWARRGNVRTHSVTAKLEPIGGEEAAPPTGKTNPFDEPPPPGTPATGTRP